MGNTPKVIELVRLRSFFSTFLAAGELAAIVTSRHEDPNSLSPALLSIQFQTARPIRSRELLESLQSAKNLPNMDIGAFRRELSSSLASFLTVHLLESQKVFIDDSDQLKLLALRFTQLLSWGETKAAKAIADIDSVPVRTIHTYLYHARQLGYLASPGKGVRSDLQERVLSSSLKRS